MTNHLRQNKTLHFACAALTGILFLAALPFAADAASARLEVEFENGSDALWGVTNFKPGESESRWVEVTNNTAAVQTVMTESVNASDPDGLGSGMTLVITSSESVLYDGVFGDFLRTGEIELGSIAPNETKRYEYSVAFLPAAADGLQGKSLGFDLCIGFKASSGGKRCGGTVIGGESTSGSGGGGGSLNLTLVIHGEQAATDQNDSGAATITWLTNKLATSQVVYGPASGTYTLDLSKPNFGYPFGTIEFQTKTTEHSVALTSLTPGMEYKYRVISRASPPTVSYEHRFILPPAYADSQPGAAGPQPSAAPAGPQDASGSPTGELPVTVAAADSNKLPNEYYETDRSNERDRNLASVFFALPENVADQFGYFGLALAIFFVLYAVASALSRGRGNTRLLTVLLVLSAAALAALYATGQAEAVRYLIFITVAGIIFLAWRRRRE